MRYWKIGLAAGACVACCAPLLAPLFIGSAFVGVGSAGLGFFGSVEAGMLALAVGLVGVWFFWWRRKSARLANADKKCGCAPDSGCNTGNACDVPQPKGSDLSAIPPLQIPTT